MTARLGFTVHFDVAARRVVVDGDDGQSRSWLNALPATSLDEMADAILGATNGGQVSMLRHSLVHGEAVVPAAREAIVAAVARVLRRHASDESVLVWWRRWEGTRAEAER